MAFIVLANNNSVLEASRHLQRDLVLAPLVERFGVYPHRPHTDYNRALVNSIIGQQLSVKAADSIKRRFLELFDGTFPEPMEILERHPAELRSAGLSGAKIRYVKDLAEHVLDGRLEFDKFSLLDNETIINEVTAVKGIGEWTAHMFLMFCMGRMNVLPTGDLGVRSGIMKLYGLSTLPEPKEVAEIAAKGSWSPYQSAASWYIWQSLDNTP